MDSIEEWVSMVRVGAIALNAPGLITITAVAVGRFKWEAGLILWLVGAVVVVTGLEYYRRQIGKLVWGYYALVVCSIVIGCRYAF